MEGDQEEYFRSYADLDVSFKIHNFYITSIFILQIFLTSHNLNHSLLPLILIFITLTTAFPVFSPLRTPLRALTIFSKPSITVSLYINFPSFNHCKLATIPSDHLANQRLTTKPSILSSLKTIEG